MDWTEWSAICSEIIRVVSKSNEREARVRFEITTMISDQNCTTRSSFWRSTHFEITQYFVNINVNLTRFLKKRNRKLCYINYANVIWQNLLERKQKQYLRVVTRLSGFVQFGDERFSSAVVRNLLVSHKTVSHGIYNGADCILAHSDLFGRLPPRWVFPESCTTPSTVRCSLDKLFSLNISQWNSASFSGILAHYHLRPFS